MAAEGEPEVAAALTQRSFEESLRRLDPDGRGSVRREDLATVMSALFPTWSEDDVEVMIGASGTLSSTGRVELERFAQWLFAGAPQETEPTQQLKSSAPRRSAESASNSGAITAEDFALALENMARAWERVPEEQRLPENEEASFFECGCFWQCREMIDRWHSGKSSHPNRERLAARYPCGETGAAALMEDLMAIRSDPDVQAADRQLRRAKFTVVPGGRARIASDADRQQPGSPAEHIDRAFQTILRDFDAIDKDPPMRRAIEGQ